MIRVRRFVNSCVAMMAVATFSFSTAFGQSDIPSDKVTRTYYAQVNLYSIIPKVGLGSYRTGGRMSFGPNSSSESGIYNRVYGFQVRMEGRMKSGRFLASFEVKPSAGGEAAVIEKQARELDLTDLKPESIEIARDPDGRVYRVNIVPTVKETPLPKVFRADDLELDHWSFHDSAVILDEQTYLGSMNMAGGNLATIVVPGLADVELSLVPLKGSTDEGVLENGSIRIRHGHTTVTVKNVRTGDSSDELKRGAIKVFVRWKPPGESYDQYRERIQSQIDLLKTRLKEGDTTISKERIERMQQNIDSHRYVSLTSIMSHLRPEDIDSSK